MSLSPAHFEASKAYIALYENLDPRQIENCDKFVAADIVFVDPFNDIHGIVAFKAMLKHSLTALKNPRFTVTNQAWDGDTLFVRWDFSAGLPLIGAWAFTGMSAVTFDDNHKVKNHIDYWDSGQYFYGLLPLIGPLIRWIRKYASMSKSHAKQ